VSLEDMLGLDEQPNLPGTVDVHPNWRRRLAAPIGEVSEEPNFTRRCAILNAARQRGAASDGG
jgi:4-alpha-glucanotransferase